MWPTGWRRAVPVAAGLAATASAIYPDDHWTHSKRLTENNFAKTVQAEIDAGKTMFVRWISLSRMRAPAWNEVVRAFAGNDGVSFGDVNLSEDPIRGEPHNPGSGGWPTIRYFNKETGIDGGNYQKKTDLSMCDELGDEERMTAYVEEYGNVALCSISGEGYPGCDEREIGYIDKMKGKGADECKKQLDRLQGMDGGKMKPELERWLKQRKKILKQLVTEPSSGSDEL